MQVKLEDLSTEQIESLCYRQICQKTAAERALMALEQELARRQQQPQPEPQPESEPPKE